MWADQKIRVFFVPNKQENAISSCLLGLAYRVDERSERSEELLGEAALVGRLGPREDQGLAQAQLAVQQPAQELQR